jgi:hypothetical protein
MVRRGADPGSARTEIAEHEENEENEHLAFRGELRLCIAVAPYITWYIHNHSHVSITSRAAKGHPGHACSRCTPRGSVNPTIRECVDPWIYNIPNPCSNSVHARMLGVSAVSFLNLFMLSWSLKSNSSPDVMAFCEVSTTPPGRTGCRACAKHQRPPSMTTMHDLHPPTWPTRSLAVQCEMDNHNHSYPPRRHLAARRTQEYLCPPELRRWGR